MATVSPHIAPEVFVLAPEFRALSIEARSLINGPTTDFTSEALSRACASPCAEPWAEEHREAWRQVFRAFGAKPQRTPCSAEALLKRVQRDGVLSSVNAVVDLYNAVSLQFAVPVGGENAAAYAGPPQLVRAQGNEQFDTIQSGIAVRESPDPGEVVWRDSVGVTCRRWNWRQGVRTRIELATTHMWFILEALPPMPDAALHRAGDVLMEGLSHLSPRVTFDVKFLGTEKAPSGEA